MIRIRVRYVSTIFISEQSPFSILKMIDEETKESITCKGNFLLPRNHEFFEFKGKYVDDDRYGLQFNVVSITILPDELAVISSLSSSIFKGIGQKSAKSIVEVLGCDAINILSNDHSKVDLLKLTENQKKNLLIGLKSMSCIEPCIEKLMKNHISIQTISLLQGHYQEKLDQLLQENPYQIMFDINSIGFKKVDEIGLILNSEFLNMNRLVALAYHLCSQTLFKNGSTIILLTDFYEKMNKSLNNELSTDLYFMVIEQTIKLGLLCIYEEYITIKSLFNAEQSIYEYVTRSSKNSIFLEKIKFEHIRQLEQTIGIKYDNLQLESIKCALNNSFSIITGGPGTGKTTIINAILKMLAYDNHYNVAVVAPTGRAAKRISSTCAVDSMTIHRFLKWDMHTNEFSYNKENPLYHNCLIVDEMSMVDSILFSALLNALPNLEKIILIGDDNQLQSVGSGNVLKDLIDSNCVHTIVLEKVFRQKNDSNILELIHSVKNGSLDCDLFDGKQVEYINADESDISTVVIDKYLECCSSDTDIQILAPLYRGSVGILAINTSIQSALLEGSVRFFGYSVGDRVIQLKNNNEINVYNGDIGIVVSFSEFSKSLNIDFDGKIHTYFLKDLEQISLAYAISIHKSQGSEYQTIIIPLSRQHTFMFQRNLIYTALSRAKRRIILIGDFKVLTSAIDKVNTNQRVTLLNFLFS